MTDTNQTRFPSSEDPDSGPAPQDERPRHTLMRAGACVAVLVALAGAGTMWLASNAATIRDELEATAPLIPQLKDEALQGDSSAAKETVDELKSHTAKAREAANDPLWTMAGALPWLGPNFQAVSTMATAADDVAQLGAGPLVDVAQSLDWEALTPNGRGLDLQPLTAAQHKLVSAAHAVRQSADRLDGIDTSALLPEISAPLARARNQLTTLRGGLDTAADTAKVAPSMLGAAAPRNYLLLVQNNAESRATGGIPGALAVLKVDNGKLTLSGQTSATALGVMSPTIPVEPEQQRIYSGRIGKFMQDVTLTPEFPTSARTALAMWNQKTGQSLDGVISIDPVALSYILDATGSVKLTDPALQLIARNSLPTELSSKNVVPTLLSRAYSEITEPALQDVYFAGVAKEIFGALSAGKADAKGLMSGMKKAAEERRILLWSTNAEEQNVISGYPLGGSISGPSVSPAEFGVYFNDGTGAKMDYYVKRTAQLVKVCANDGYSEIKVRVTSTNTARADAATSLPAYVTGGGAFGVPEGTVQTNVVAYGPAQSNVETASVGGTKTGFASQRHNGRPVGAVTIRLAPGKSSTVEFTFGKIVQHTEPKLSVTPTVQARKDVVLDTTAAKCVPAT